MPLASLTSTGAGRPRRREGRKELTRETLAHASRYRACFRRLAIWCPVKRS